MECNNFCKEFKSIGISAKNGRYGQGQKRCTFCGVFLMWKGIHCPCCGYLLRTKPRSKRLKQKLMCTTLSTNS